MSSSEEDIRYVLGEDVDVESSGDEGSGGSVSSRATKSNVSSSTEEGENSRESSVEVDNESSDGELSTEDEIDLVHQARSVAPPRKKKRSAMPVYLKKLLDNNIDTALSVSERNRAKIVTKQYIDFASLINKKKGEALSFGQWSEAFHIFGIIYAAQFPEEGYLLFHHADLIRQAHVSSHQWLDYDIAFRKKMALAHGDGHVLSSSKLSWGHTDEGLWRKYILSPAAAHKVVNKNEPSSSARLVVQPSTSNFLEPSTSAAVFNPYRQGWCVAFNKFPAGCNKPRCPFKHECVKCHQPRCRERFCPRSNN